MIKTKEYSEDFKESVLKALRAGEMTQSQIVRTFCVSRQLVSHLKMKFLRTGTPQNKTRSGRPEITTENTDRLIRRLSVSDVQRSAVSIRNELEEIFDVEVHVSTVKRRLVNFGLHGRRPARRPLISVKNRKLRLAFAREHGQWRLSEWSKVLRSDESKFNLNSYEGRYQVPTVKHGGGNLMLWGCFSRDCVEPLVRIRGIMHRFGYQKILLSATVESQGC